ncbi:MAG: O-antigen ligase family protein, partial [Hyphomicrobiales bacterium]
MARAVAAASGEGLRDMATERPSSSAARLMVQLQAALLGLLCFSGPAAPRVLPVLIGALGITAAIHVFRTEPRRVVDLVRTPIGIVLGLFIAYLFVNASWAPSPGDAYTKAAGTLGLAAAAFLIAASFSLRDEGIAKTLAKAALVGFLVGLGFLAIELAFDEPIKRFITNHIVQLFDVSTKKAKIVNGEVTGIAAFVLNRNAVSLVLLLIPGMLFARAIETGSTRNLTVAVLVLAGASCILASKSGTSVVALFLGAAVFAASALSLKVVRVLLMAAWTVVILFAVPLSALPYDLGWNRWTFLPPQSVAARFYIWKHMAGAVSAHPIGGIGIRGARELNVRLPADSRTLGEAEPTPDGRK